MNDHAKPMTDGPMVPVLGRGWAFPVRRGEGHHAMAASSDEACVRQSIFIILRTARGERVMRPGFGSRLADFVFAPNDAMTRALVAQEVRQALLEWEPRIDDLQVEVQAASHAEEVMLISIGYRVRSTDNRFSLVYPFYLDRVGA